MSYSAEEKPFSTSAHQPHHAPLSSSLKSKLASRYAELLKARPSQRPADPTPSPGLGDMVKGALSAIGITEERVTKAIGRPCGCGKRAEKLNEWGKKNLGIG